MSTKAAAGFDAWMTNGIFRHMLIPRAYTEGEFEQMARESRFGACRIHSATIGQEVRLTKAAAE